MSIEDLFGPPKKEQPKPEVPKVEVPKPEEPKVEAPKTETKVEVPKPEEKPSPPQTPLTPIEQAKETTAAPEKPLNPTSAPTSILDMMKEAPKMAMPVANPLLSGLSSMDTRRNALPEAPLPTMPEKFDFTPQTPSSLKYITIFGGKGSSKTTLALAAPGKILALSFDNKTVEAWWTMFKSDKRITVMNAIKYMDYSSPDAALMSSEITFQYINAILDRVKSGPQDEYPDWIVIDGFEEYKSIAENVMRYRNQLRLTQGVEWQYWKDRRLYIKQLFTKIGGIVKQGVIFCTKYEWEETKLGGVTVEKKKVPIWVDIVEEQTDIVIENTVDIRDTGEVKFTAHVISSKHLDIPTGHKTDITCEPGKVDIWKRLIVEEKKEEKK